MQPVPLKQVQITGGFWQDRQRTNRNATIPTVYNWCEDTGRINAWKLQGQEGHHIFWDSDVAKWIEAAAYSLAHHPDPGLESQVDSIIALMTAAQQPDGYLNSYFTAVEPDQRWTNLRDRHELYCAGHLMEAAVAYAETTGKRQLLDALCRYADYIGSVFGTDEGQMRGYPGHQEIELALVKLYQATSEQRYLDLARFFVDERGQQPHYYDQESEKRGEAAWRGYQYNQSHLPVREQSDAVGHAVRACYMYAGMADIAAETGDEALLNACKRLWESITERRMHVTGGIGPFRWNEGFSHDYDLPNETAYAESCAAIALFFFGHRMLHLEQNGRYADVMEQALYNGVISGVAQEGKAFFYANPLSAHPGFSPYTPNDLKPGDYHYRRSEWFDCACCPPNLARILAGLGAYLYSQSGDNMYVNFYASSVVSLDGLSITQETDYPWDGTVVITVQPESPQRFALYLRIPGWCSVATVDGEAVVAKNGYARIEREWQPGAQITLELSMPVQRITAHPKVRQAAGQVAIQRGPLVYCLEETDNGPELANVVLPSDSQLDANFDADLGVTVVTGAALREYSAQTALYAPAGDRIEAPYTLKAVPYYFWANRKPGEMRVWLRSK